MPIRRDLALRAVQRLSRKTGLGEQPVATGILRLVDNDMARAISMVTVERGRDPREFVMVAFGGAGPLQACDLAEELGISKVLVPAHAGLFSAYGLLAGELTRTFTSPVMEAEPLLARRFRILESEAAEAMKSEGFRRFEASRLLEARYLGQSHELLLPFSSDSHTRQDFDARHKQLYGYSLADKMEVVNIRVRATVRRSPPVLNSGQSQAPQPPTEREAWVGRGTRIIPVFARGSLLEGEGGRGPCIIEDYDSTTVVNPSWRWSAETYGVRLQR
jgi:N-methylhydantoinase A